jgi:hypothetical protein
VIAAANSSSRRDDIEHHDGELDRQRVGIRPCGQYGEIGVGQLGTAATDQVAEVIGAVVGICNGLMTSSISSSANGLGSIRSLTTNHVSRALLALLLSDCILSKN